MSYTGAHVYIMPDGSCTTDRLKAERKNWIGWLLTGKAPKKARIITIEVDGKLADVVISPSIEIDKKLAKYTV